MVEKKVNKSKIRLIRGDIADLDVEAFVYDITPDAKLGTGYGSAIMARAGKAVQTELDAIGSCPTGEAVITSAGRMKAKNIIHLNGPKFHEPDQEGKLRRAVTSALKRAEENGIKQLAFPPVRTGFYQVDLKMCAKVMVDTVTSHLSGNSNLEEVLFVALDTREHTPFEAQIGQGG
jgi:O-acetyl-ADP-ribose deacetylase (regulator of RNase III)